MAIFLWRQSLLGSEGEGTEEKWGVVRMEGSVILQQGTRKRESEAFQPSLSPAECPRVEAQELECPNSDMGSASCLSSLGLSYR